VERIDEGRKNMEEMEDIDINIDITSPSSWEPSDFYVK
jgi:hypothetical protein